MTHFYSDKKNTQQMIKMMDLLRAQYHNCSTIYLSWDAASWHISHDLARHVKQRNHEAQAEGYPIVKTAPLPTGAHFLNVIESVFSGMARAIIHNSDYGSVEAAKERSTAITLNGTNTFRRAPKEQGAHPPEAFYRQGIPFIIARTWWEGDRTVERKLKNLKNASVI